MCYEKNNLKKIGLLSAIIVLFLLTNIVIGAVTSHFLCRDMENHATIKICIVAVCVLTSVEMWILVFLLTYRMCKKGHEEFVSECLKVHVFLITVSVNALISVMIYMIAYGRPDILNINRPEMDLITFCLMMGTLINTETHAYLTKRLVCGYNANEQKDKQE